MTSFECYKLYLALKQHFTSPQYDYFKYNGKVSATVNAFENRKDKIFFAKVAKHRDPFNFLVSNLIINEKAWIKDIAYSEKANQIYQEWLRRNQAITYIFNQEITQLTKDFDVDFKCIDGRHPLLIRLFMQNKIGIDTLVIIADLFHCIEYWKKHINDPVINSIIDKISKVTPFIVYPKDKIKKIILDFYRTP